MAVPTFVNVGTKGEGVGDVVPGLPSGWAENDIFLLMIEGEGEDANADPGPASGWTYIGTIANDTAGSAWDTRLTLYWRRATASESAPTVPDAGDHTLAVIAAFRGCLTTATPIHQQASSSSDASATAISFPAVTTTVNDCLILHINTNGDDSTVSGWTNANLANPSITEFMEELTIQGSDGSIHGAYGGLESSGGSGTGSATCSSKERYASFTLALEPGVSAVIINADALTLASSPQDMTLVPGAYTVPADYLTLASAPQDMSLYLVSKILADPLTLASAPQTVAVIPGEYIILADLLTLASSVQNATIFVDQILSMSDISLASSPQVMSLIPGLVTLSMNDLTLISSPETMTLLPGEYTILADLLTLVSSPQSMSLSLATVVPMNDLTLASAIQTMTLLSPYTIAADVLTLASSPQAMNLSLATLVAMEEITLASSPQSMSVIPPDHIASMSELTLASSLQVLSVIPGQYIVSADYLTLASSIPAMTLTPGEYAVLADVLTLASSPQNMSIVAAGAGQQISMSEITLTSSVGSMSLITTIPPVVISVDPLTLTSAVEVISLLMGEAIIGMNPIILVSVAQDLIVVTGTIPKLRPGDVLVTSNLSGYVLVHKQEGFVTIVEPEEVDYDIVEVKLA